MVLDFPQANSRGELLTLPCAWGPICSANEGARLVMAGQQ
jgi:hypothetical protein